MANGVSTLVGDDGGFSLFAFNRTQSGEGEESDSEDLKTWVARLYSEVLDDYPDLAEGADLRWRYSKTFALFRRIGVASTDRFASNGPITISFGLEILKGNVGENELKTTIFHELLHADQLQRLGINSTRARNDSAYEETHDLIKQIELDYSEFLRLRNIADRLGLEKPDLCRLPWRECEE